jgi:hypothetical protein
MHISAQDAEILEVASVPRRPCLSSRWRREKCWQGSNCSDSHQADLQVLLYLSSLTGQPQGSGDEIFAKWQRIWG